MAKRLIPAFNRVLVEKIVPSSKTNTGILLPEKSSKLNSGKVVAIGPGIRDRDGKHIPISLKEGDVVLLPDYGGTEVKLEGKEELLISFKGAIGDNPKQRIPSFLYLDAIRKVPPVP
ncbi:10 kDa chaperonin, mitochondrial-like isoform X2 [Phalaenopsis equestris]|uniref:10 kDa chaperonin, mitochondrial-like isoform X2 n=1 Tax=Phalaenopsis equestris TaxID=78828 RepID=UPI0009E2AA82|nr:10 kDa chaperonin, mitochondrial-like isoform X2 [Phalaenopsis equestris]